MIDTDKYEGHTEGPWDYCEDEVYAKGNPCIVALRAHGTDGKLTSKLPHRWADFALIADAPLLLAEVKRLHKNKSNLFTTIEQKLNEKGDEGEAISVANPNGHYKEDELRGWCEALEFVLNLMKAQEREE